jgi:transcriptional regulator with XRE-family HTH domain
MVEMAANDCGEPMYNAIFFTNVLRISDEVGLSKNELADRAGISVSFLSDLTNGRANPSLKIMEAIATALEMPLPPLLEMTDLDQETMRVLTNGKATSMLPEGLVRSTAILTEYQDFMVKQWDRENRKGLARTRSAKNDTGTMPSR